MSDVSHDRSVISAAIDAARPEFSGRNAALTGWVVVSEWMDDSGERWLSSIRSEFTTRWAEIGMLYEVINGDWSDDD